MGQRRLGRTGRALAANFDDAPELAHVEGSLHISGIDRKTGEPVEGLVSPEHIAAAFGDRRRRDEPDP
jgi:hypothetical protein